MRLDISDNMCCDIRIEFEKTVETIRLLFSKSISDLCFRSQKCQSLLLKKYVDNFITTYNEDFHTIVKLEISNWNQSNGSIINIIKSIDLNNESAMEIGNKLISDLIDILSSLFWNIQKADYTVSNPNFSYEDYQYCYSCLNLIKKNVICLLSDLDAKKNNKSNNNLIYHSCINLLYSIVDNLLGILDSELQLLIKISRYVNNETNNTLDIGAKYAISLSEKDKMRIFKNKYKFDLPHKPSHTLIGHNSNGNDDIFKGQRERDITDKCFLMHDSKSDITDLQSDSNVRSERILSQNTEYCMGVKIKGNIPKAYSDAIAKRYNDALESTKKLFDKYSKYLSIQNTELPLNKTPHYKPIGLPGFRRGVYLNVSHDMSNPKSAGTTFFHELGHMIDHVSTGFLGFSSNTVEFKNALIDDGKEILSSYNNMTLENQAEFLNVIRSPYAHSVSDLIDAITSGQIHGFYAHSEDYWRTPGNLQAEAFAHFFEASMGADEKKITLLKALFPNAFSVFLSIVDTI